MIVEQRRIIRGGTTWHAKIPSDVATVYTQIKKKFHWKNPERALQYLHLFTVHFNGSTSQLVHPSDPRTLASASTCDVIRAWEAMVDAHRWTHKHMVKVRAWLSRAMSVHVESLAYTINPTLRQGSGLSVLCHRSQRPRVTIHECLPLRVRSNLESPLYKIVTFFVQLFARRVFRSFSPGTLKHIASLFTTLFLPHKSLKPPDVAAFIQEVGKWDAFAWLCLYGESHSPQSVVYSRFYRDIRHLSLLHAKGFNGTPPFIPTPEAPTMEDGSPSDMHDADTSVSWGSTGDEAKDACLTVKQRQLGSLLWNIQRQICRCPHSLPPDGHQDGKRYALSDTEVVDVVKKAHSVPERLMVMLLLQYGMRIGGLCRIRTTISGMEKMLQKGAHVLWSDVPSDLSTSEKNGARRVISNLSPRLRVLVAQYMRWHRPVAGSHNTYVFTAVGGRKEFMDPSTAWRVVRGVLTRANVPTKLAHPHTFRHTCIQMLYNNGLSFTEISKWIGHRNESITSNIYGQLQHQDLQNRVSEKVPFLASGPQVSVRERWKRVAKFLSTVYDFDNDEQCPPAKRAHVTRQEDILNRANNQPP